MNQMVFIRRIASILNRLISTGRFVGEKIKNREQILHVNQGIQYRQWFWIWLTIRTFAWFLVATLTQPNAPLDLIEWTGWGNYLAWGYPKHPPFPAWVAGVFSRLSPGEVWGVYLASDLIAAMGIYCVWKLALEFLSPVRAFLAVVCLDGSIYWTGDLSEFSNNVVLNTAWVALALTFYRAIQNGDLKWWIASGLILGLGLLSKYTIGLLVVVQLGYLIFTPSTRHHLRTIGPYLSFFVALLLFTPHLIWLVQNDFVTLKYAADRATRGNWTGHFVNPTIFVGSQVLKLLPLAVILFPILSLRNSFSNPKAFALTAIVIGPIAILVFASLITGNQLRDIWGSPLTTLTGVWLLAYFGSERHDQYGKCLKLFMAVSIGVFIFCSVKNVAMPYLNHRPSRMTYPGKQLAEWVNQRWNERSSSPFPIVAGEAWRAGNICCYSPHRPVIYSTGDMGYLKFEAKFTPWTNDEDLRSRGGVFVWDANLDGNDLPQMIRLRFPDAKFQAVIDLPYSTRAEIPSDRIGIAFAFPFNSQKRTP